MSPNDAYYCRVCGRYVLAADPAVLVSEFDAEILGDIPKPNYNVAPTTKVPVVVSRERARIIECVRWGIVPAWSSSKPMLLVNARGESVAEKSTFKKSFAGSRCIIPASGYYEWMRPAKDPFFITDPQKPVLAMGGILVPSSIDGHTVPTCAIITVSAAQNIAHIHDRMPAMIPKGMWSEWLDPDIGSADALSILDSVTASAANDLVARPVSKRVNSVRNNGVELLDSVS